MRKKNKVFLILVVLMVGLLMTSCTKSAVTNDNTGSADNDGGDQLSGILTEVAANTPVGEVTPVGEGDGFAAATPTSLVVSPPEPTATPVPPTPTTVPTTSAPVVPSTYTLHEGEWPYCLARRFNIDVDDLLAANNLARGAVYPTGLTLTIPQNASTFDGERMLVTHPVTYTVLYDDTFYSIACYFGDVYPEEIAAANGMSLTDTLTVGMQLSIP
jgi:LysM repeat protein